MLGRIAWKNGQAFWPATSAENQLLYIIEARKGNKKRAESRVAWSSSHVKSLDIRADEKQETQDLDHWISVSHDVKLYTTGDFEG